MAGAGAALPVGAVVWYIKDGVKRPAHVVQHDPEGQQYGIKFDDEASAAVRFTVADNLVPAQLPGG